MLHVAACAGVLCGQSVCICMYHAAGSVQQTLQPITCMLREEVQQKYTEAGPGLTADVEA